MTSCFLYIFSCVCCQFHEALTSLTTVASICKMCHVALINVLALEMLSCYHHWWGPAYQECRGVNTPVKNLKQWGMGVDDEISLQVDPWVDSSERCSFSTLRMSFHCSRASIVHKWDVRSNFYPLNLYIKYLFFSVYFQIFSFCLWFSAI